VARACVWAPLDFCVVASSNLLWVSLVPFFGCIMCMRLGGWLEELWVHLVSVMPADSDHTSLTISPPWQACTSDIVVPTGMKVLEVGCSAHALTTMDKNAAGCLPDACALPMARQLLQMIDCGNKVPSATPALIDMLLDVMSENTRGYPLSDPNMFKDGNGDFTFAARMRPYLSHYTTRVCANLCNSLGGGPGTNNAVERMNREIHHQFPARRGPQAHLHDLLSGSHSLSLSDDAFNNEPRRDMYHAELWRAVLQSRHLCPYVHFPEVTINLMKCTLATRLYIEELDESKAMVEPGERASWNLQTDLKRTNTNALLLPTLQTISDVVQGTDTSVHGGKLVNAVCTEEKVMTFVDSRCTLPHDEDSWKQQFETLINEGSGALHTMNLWEWWELTNTFAMLTPMSLADTTTFLRMLETGIPSAGATTEPHLSNGCTVHWDKVGDNTAMRCWCEDFQLRSICFHAAQYVVHQDFVSPPAKWGGVGGASCGQRAGRPTHFRPNSVRAPRCMRLSRLSLCACVHAHVGVRACCCSPCLCDTVTLHRRGKWMKLCRA
jgi:hypothetical protein